jgi:hypothetical protein
MNPFGRGIKQHETHRVLTRQTGPRASRLPRLDLDAIIVPGSRPAAHLDHAVTLARAADCWLVVLCSQQLVGAEVKEFLAARSHDKAIVIDLAPGYSHPLLDFPGLLSIRDELPEACGFCVTDLSMKRNMGLVLARMLGWRYIFFLDDDIRDITHPDLQTTVNMLGSFSAAGLWVTDFPDNSIVCHANRITGRSQDVFVSGAALAVNCDADIGFFPDIYHEDWLFFFADASKGRLANSCLKATQLRYYPFANAQRAAWQEFGDIIAEGLYALLHLDLEVQHATRDYWTHFLETRRNFLEAIISRSANAPANVRNDMVHSVQQALKCSLTVKPDVCERYVQLWRQDLAAWQWRAAAIPPMSSVEAALTEMRLAPDSSNLKVLCYRNEITPTISAGPVAIPRFDTVKEMSEHASTLRLASATPADKDDERQHTIPFPVVTEEYPATMLTAKTNGLVALDQVGGRQRRQRLDRPVSWLANTWQRRRSPAQPASPLGNEPVGPGGRSGLASPCDRH